MSIKSHFYPGEEWIYIKIYSNRFNCYNILIAEIRKLTDFLIKNSYIDKWFYIFFSEPADFGLSPPNFAEKKCAQSIKKK